MTKEQLQKRLTEVEERLPDVEWDRDNSQSEEVRNKAGELCETLKQLRSNLLETVARLPAKTGKEKLERAVAVARSRIGAKPVAMATAHGGYQRGARENFRALIREAKENGLSHEQAFRSVNKRYPQLREMVIREANPGPTRRYY